MMCTLRWLVRQYSSVRIVFYSPRCLSPTMLAVMRCIDTPVFAYIVVRYGLRTVTCLVTSLSFFQWYRNRFVTSHTTLHSRILLTQSLVVYWVNKSRATSSGIYADLWGGYPLSIATKWWCFLATTLVIVAFSFFAQRGIKKYCTPINATF